MITIKDCKNPRVVSIVIHGGAEHIVEETHRAVYDAVRGVQAAIEDGKVVAGGSAPEVEIAMQLREYASTLSGIPLSVEAYSRSCMAISTSGALPPATTLPSSIAA